jgi:hypothetical protein
MRADPDVSGNGSCHPLALCSACWFAVPLRSSAPLCRSAAALGRPLSLPTRPAPVSSSPRRLPFPSLSGCRRPCFMCVPSFLCVAGLTDCRRDSERAASQRQALCLSLPPPCLARPVPRGQPSGGRRGKRGGTLRNRQKRDHLGALLEGGRRTARRTRRQAGKGMRGTTRRRGAQVQTVLHPRCCCFVLN